MAETVTWQNRITRYGEEAPDQLLAHPLNFRVHPKAQQDTLAGVLNEVGVVQNIIVNERTNTMIDGHLRVTLAMRQNQPTVPVTYVDLSPEEEALILATLDPIAAMANADADKLRELLDDVSTGDAAVMAMLSDMAEREGIVDFRGTDGLTDPDDVPEPPADPITQPGDLWLLGKHRLLCGDSTKAEDVARLMNGERSALMPTDPPYLVDYQGGNHPQSWANKAETRDKHWDDYNEADGSDFFARFLRVALEHALTDRPAIYQWHATRRQALVEEARKENGLLVHQTIIWFKARAVLTRSHYMWQHEPCFYGWIEGRVPELKPPADAKSVWEINQQGESDGIHPTQKPVEIVKRPIEYHTRPGDLIYEPFSGSGTALIAAEQTGRRCYAMELAPEFVDVAVTRWEQFTGNAAIRATAEMAAD